MKNLIQEEFDKFALQCFGNISKQQYIDLRRTFFAGTAAIYGLMMREVSTGDTITQEDIELMAGIQIEINLFNEDVKAGRK